MHWDRTTVITLPTIAQNINEDPKYTKIDSNLYPKMKCGFKTDEMLKGKIIFIMQQLPTD